MPADPAATVRAAADVARSDLNLATAWEAVADAVPARLALWCGDVRRTLGRARRPCRAGERRAGGGRDRAGREGRARALQRQRVRRSRVRRVQGAGGAVQRQLPLRRGRDPLRARQRRRRGGVLRRDVAGPHRRGARVVARVASVGRGRRRGRRPRLGRGLRGADRDARCLRRASSVTATTCGSSTPVARRACRRP